MTVRLGLNIPAPHPVCQRVMYDYGRRQRRYPRKTPNRLPPGITAIWRDRREMTAIFLYHGLRQSRHHRIAQNRLLPQYYRRMTLPPKNANRLPPKINYRLVLPPYGITVVDPIVCHMVYPEKNRWKIETP